MLFYLVIRPLPLLFLTLPTIRGTSRHAVPLVARLVVVRAGITRRQGAGLLPPAEQPTSCEPRPTPETARPCSSDSPTTVYSFTPIAAPPIPSIPRRLSHVRLSPERVMLTLVLTPFPQVVSQIVCTRTESITPTVRLATLDKPISTAGP